MDELQVVIAHRPAPGQPRNRELLDRELLDDRDRLARALPNRLVHIVFVLRSDVVL